VRPVAFKEKIGALQLALCSAGHGCGDFLRARLARTSSRASVDDHAHLRGLVVVVVVLGAKGMLVKWRCCNSCRVRHSRIIPRCYIGAERPWARASSSYPFSSER